ncbi:uncharacterized protein TRIVIDRAFT_186251 [Trichoderma virens Gv29-8]|uniref:Nuclear transport factor 2 n=1 Tax=Hypocrea virens (strain Gv29-8 / FGSC 10586) TaxID=413071 RepID=G9MP94_HYPVG|nr:uncharacterized protein TRIVIDRAFT_186251 [Trichoderma virens Gv29-8]EHK23696.1 hypothetical protein TRIVIDRAFT_186251 [Trichoderma virens Gv29-8]UKZ49991.1 hypothetical protein TrVGV298_004246 [Trichoderma virens]
MSNLEDIAKQFVNGFFTGMSSNIQGLAAVYNAESVLTFESQKFEGVQAILEKLTSLPFKMSGHQLSTLDAQLASGDLLILITGKLKIDEDENLINFVQNFKVSVSQGPGGEITGFTVKNDIFKLVY